MKLIERTGEIEWEIINMIHKAIICLGFYHAKFLIRSNKLMIVNPGVPYYNYNNVFSLVSDVGKLVRTNLVFNERRQIAYNIF
jgi:hypothetical protein